MSLLTICQSACQTTPISVPSFIIGNSDQTAVLLLGLASDACESLARRPQNGWVSMIREYDFSTAAVLPQSGTIANVGGFGVISGLTGISAITTGIWQASGTGVPLNAIVTAVTSTTVTINQAATQTGAGTFQFGQSDYPLPADFTSVVDGTLWDRSRYWEMRGPLSPQQWQLYKSSPVGRASIQRRYRFRTIRNAAGNSPGLYISIDPVPYDNGGQLVMEYQSNAWCESLTGTPQSSWMLDTDVCLLDEYIIKLAVKWRLLRRMGLSYSEELSEFEQLADQAMAADGGMPTLNIAQSRVNPLITSWSVPDSGYGH